MEKNEIGPLCHSISKNQLKIHQHLNVRIKITKILEENIGIYLSDFEFGKSLSCGTKIIIKNKIGKLDFIKMKTLGLQRTLS